MEVLLYFCLNFRVRWKWVVNATSRLPLPLGITLYPFYRRLFLSRVRSEKLRKGSPPSRFDPQTIQHVASRYTDCTIPVHVLGISIVSNVSKSPLDRLGTAYKLQRFCLYVQPLGLKEDMRTLLCLVCSLLHAYHENICLPSHNLQPTDLGVLPEVFAFVCFGCSFYFATVI